MGPVTSRSLDVGLCVVLRREREDFRGLPVHTEVQNVIENRGGGGLDISLAIVCEGVVELVGYSWVP